MKINKNLTFATGEVTLHFSTQITLAGMLALLVLPARADSFGTGTNTFSMNTVEISNPGNGDDLGGVAAPTPGRMAEWTTFIASGPRRCLRSGLQKRHGSA